MLFSLNNIDRPERFLIIALAYHIWTKLDNTLVQHTSKYLDGIISIPTIQYDVINRTITSIFDAAIIAALFYLFIIKIVDRSELLKSIRLPRWTALFFACYMTLSYFIFGEYSGRNIIEIPQIVLAAANEQIVWFSLLMFCRLTTKTILYSVILYFLFILAHQSPNLLLLLYTLGLAYLIQISEKNFWKGIMIHALANHTIFMAAIWQKNAALKYSGTQVPLLEILPLEFYYLGAIILLPTFLALNPTYASKNARAIFNALFSFPYGLNILYFLFSIARIPNELPQRFLYGEKYVSKSRTQVNGLILDRKFKTILSVTSKLSSNSMIPVGPVMPKFKERADALIWWHTYDFDEAKFRLLLNGYGDFRPVVVFRRISNSSYEDSWREICKTLGRELIFIHNPKELVRFVNRTQVGDYVWLFGAEYLIDNRIRGIQRILTSQLRTCWLHQPWKDNGWVFTSFSINRVKSDLTNVVRIKSKLLINLAEIEID